jgi:hypothetical protein
MILISLRALRQPDDGIFDEVSSLHNSDVSLFDEARTDDSLGILGEDAGLVKAIQKTDLCESNFCTSVRNELDDTGTPQWKPPKYKDKMVVICNMLERRCHTYLTAPLIIRDIADWFLFRNGSLPPSPLSVLVRMRNMDDIFKLDFIDCYDRMNGLYDLEMAKERRKRKEKKFNDCFEELIESWALVDMTQTMLVSEERGSDILVTDLLSFATTRVRLLHAIERLLLHHFQDSPSGGAMSLEACFKDKGRVLPIESESLEVYCRQIQRRGDEVYDFAFSGKGDLYYL